MSKKNHKISLRTMKHITVICGIILILAGSFTIYESVTLKEASLHNIDLSFNAVIGINDINNYLLSDPQLIIDHPKIRQKLKLDFRDINDRNTNYQERPLSYSYIDGINGINTAMNSVIVGTLVFSLGLSIIVVPSLNKKRGR